MNSNAKDKIKSLVTVFALSTLGFGMQACEKDSATENRLEDAGDKASDAVKDAADEVNDAAKDATEDVSK